MQAPTEDITKSTLKEQQTVPTVTRVYPSHLVRIGRNPGIQKVRRIKMQLGEVCSLRSVGSHIRCGWMETTPTSWKVRPFVNDQTIIFWNINWRPSDCDKRVNPWIKRRSFYYTSFSFFGNTSFNSFRFCFKHNHYPQWMLSMLLFSTLFFETDFYLDGKSSSLKFIFFHLLSLQHKSEERLRRNLASRI